MDAEELGFIRSGDVNTCSASETDTELFSRGQISNFSNEEGLPAYVLFRVGRPQKPAFFINKALAPFPGTTSVHGINRLTIPRTEAVIFFVHSQFVVKPD